MKIQPQRVNTASDGAPSLYVATTRPHETSELHSARDAVRQHRNLPEPKRSAADHPLDLGPASGLLLGFSISVGFWAVAALMVWWNT